MYLDIINIYTSFFYITIKCETILFVYVLDILL